MPRDEAKVAALRVKVEHKQRLRRTIAYIDPLDLQYSRFERVPKPTTQAVMFCLMDASASMTEPLKDLAKRFFMLLARVPLALLSRGSPGVHTPHQYGRPRSTRRRSFAAPRPAVR